MLVETSRNGVYQVGTPDHGKAETVHGWLYDFDIDGSRVKLNHQIWLAQNVVSPIIRNPHKKWRINLEGRCSRTGSQSHNYQLSVERAQAVQVSLQRVLGHSSNVQIKATGVGQSKAHGKRREDAGDRGVDVAVQDITPQPTPQPRPHPIASGTITDGPPTSKPPAQGPITTKPPVSAPAPVNPGTPDLLPDVMRTQTFTIRQALAVSPSSSLKLGFGPGLDVMAFLMSDTRGHAGIYVYVGGGFGFTLPSAAWLEKIKWVKDLITSGSRWGKLIKLFSKGSLTGFGPANQFPYPGRTTKTAYDFSGGAAFVTAGANYGTPWSKNILAFGGFDVGNLLQADVVIKGFNTGNTLGHAGAGFTIGYMKYAYRWQ
jgi:hypothetical protein